MSWFDKARGLIEEGLEGAQEGLEKSVEIAKEGLEQSLANARDNAEEARSEKQARREEIQRRRKVFNATAKSEYLEADLNNGLWRLTAAKKDIYLASDLIGYELIQDGDTLTSGGLGVGRAMVGGALVGPVGAVLGGLTKGKKSSAVTNTLQVRISNSALENPTVFIPIIEKKTKHKSRRYRNAIETAQEILTILDMISTHAEKNAEASIVVEKSSDNLDKIRKLKDLLDEGIITQEEFEKKKKQLLF